MENTKGLLILAAMIAVLVFFLTPGVIWAYSFNGQKNLVQGSSSETNKVNKMVAGTHAAVIALAIVFGYPMMSKLANGV